MKIILDICRDEEYNENDFRKRFHKREESNIGIKDVAKYANVSVATVSRVLNGTAAVAEPTREKVLEAAQLLGYSPNLLGKNLRERRTRIVLVMLSSLANTFCSKVIRGIEKEAAKNGYNIMICATGDSKESEQVYLNFVRNKMADGMIILNSTLSGQEMKEYSAQFPVVQCSEYTDTQTTPFVSIDNRAAAYDAVSHLIRSGRRKIAYLGVDNGLISSRLRLEGYRAALSDNGIPFDEDLVLCGNYGYRKAIRVVNDFLKRKIPFDAVFAISDRMAAGSISALRAVGLNVPQEVSVIGFDNTDITYMFEPNITTVAQPQNEMGECAFRLLMQLFEGQQPENVILPHKLIVRDSTDS